MATINEPSSLKLHQVLSRYHLFFIHLFSIILSIYYILNLVFEMLRKNYWAIMSFPPRRLSLLLTTREKEWEGQSVCVPVYIMCSVLFHRFFFISLPFFYHDITNSLSLSHMLAASLSLWVIIRDCTASGSWGLAWRTCGLAHICSRSYVAPGCSAGPSKYHWLPRSQHLSFTGLQ